MYVYAEAVQNEPGDNLRFTAVASDDLSLVVVRMDEFQGVGRAIRHPDDPANWQLGADLATARALIDLGQNLERDALRRAGVSV